MVEGPLGLMGQGPTCRGVAMETRSWGHLLVCGLQEPSESVSESILLFVTLR